MNISLEYRYVPTAESLFLFTLHSGTLILRYVKGTANLLLLKEQCCKGTPDLTIWQHNNVN